MILLEKFLLVGADLCVWPLYNQQVIKQTPCIANCFSQENPTSLIQK